MKKILTLVCSFILLAGISTSSNACDVGDVYVEGNSFFGICFGQSGSDCPRCIPFERKK